MVAVLVPCPVFAQAPKKDRLSNSVDRGLAFLAVMQEKNGAWQLHGMDNPAVTSLATMAFLSAGHVPGEGPYQTHVEKGIRYVLTREQSSGAFGLSDFMEMYQHGICTLMLCEVAAMMDAKTSKELKPKLEKAVKLILQAQRTENNLHRGGWRYQIWGIDADMSVTGWQIMALRSARNLGCDVPADRIESAMQYVLNCRDPRTGGFSYMAGPGMVNSSCTGTGILALELVGKRRHHSRETLQAGSWILKHPLRHEEPYFFYAAYYTSQAMFQLGGNYWAAYRPHLHKLLLDGQQRNGSWLNNEPQGAAYNTAMAILGLTVEYRLLPIYQRDEDADADKK